MAQKASPGHPPPSAFRAFIDSEAAGGVVLMIAAAAALVVANSPAAAVYFATLKTYVGPLSVQHWINDLLMAVFFLLVGLEIKRELVDGHLGSWPRRLLPGLAALGGMIGPALIFLAINAGSPETLRGWAIPAATDIAFALGVLALLGPRVPVSLKVFLTALAILDDLGAIVIIAVFYASDLSPLWLGLSIAVVAVLVGMNRAGVRSLVPFLIGGAILWLCVFQSGIHATLAGVALALTIPIEPSPGHPDVPESPLHRLEHALDPWVTFLIVPVFGFANAGVPYGGATLATLAAPLPLGIAAGLFFGKQLGVFLTVWLSVRLGWARRPKGASYLQVYGVAIICGIGFTMSLFIGLLAFPDSDADLSALKTGVLVGSALSAVLGSAVIAFAARARGKPFSAGQR